MTPLDSAPAFPYAIRENVHGNMFIIGGAKENMASSQYWVVHRSTDGGATWSIVDVLQPAVQGAFPDGNSLEVDSSGAVYAFGACNSQAVTASQNQAAVPVQLCVRESTDEGQTWTTVDNYTPTVTSAPPSPGFSQTGWINPANHDVFALGTISQYSGTSNNFPSYILIRRGSGGTWTSVASVQTTLFSQYTFRVDASGTWILAADEFPQGASPTTPGPHQIKVNISRDMGATWSAVQDSMVFSGKLGTLQIDSNGKIYALEPSTVNGSHLWTLRTSSDYGQSWKSTSVFTDIDPQYETTGDLEISSANMLVARLIDTDQNDANNCTKPLYLRSSSDGGVTWVNRDNADAFSPYDSQIKARTALCTAINPLQVLSNGSVLTGSLLFLSGAPPANAYSYQTLVKINK